MFWRLSYLTSRQNESSGLTRTLAMTIMLSTNSDEDEGKRKEGKEGRRKEVEDKRMERKKRGRKGRRET